jgi:hypothetical protein
MLRCFYQLGLASWLGTLWSGETDVASGHNAILLVGETKAGKSTTGNTLAGAFDDAVFPLTIANASFSSASVTREVDAHSTQSPSGSVWTILDSPGFHDTFYENEQTVEAQIARFCGYSNRGLDAVVLVFACMRWTVVEDAQLNRVKAIFPNITRHLVIGFAGCRGHAEEALRADFDACAHGHGTGRLCALHSEIEGRVLFFASLANRSKDRDEAFRLLDRMAARNYEPYAAKEFQRAQERRAALEGRIRAAGSPPRAVEALSMVVRGWKTLDALEEIIEQEEATQAAMVQELFWFLATQLLERPLVKQAAVALLIAQFSQWLLAIWTVYGLLVTASWPSATLVVLGLPAISSPSPVPTLLLQLLPYQASAAVLGFLLLRRTFGPPVQMKPARSPRRHRQQVRTVDRKQLKPCCK